MSTIWSWTRTRTFEFVERNDGALDRDLEIPS